MEKLTGYCAVVVNLEKDNVHVHYHDMEYGFPIEDDNGLFARLILEINQAGLSWTTILKKKDNFFRAFDDFDIDKRLRRVWTAMIPIYEVRELYDFRYNTILREPE